MSNPSGFSSTLRSEANIDPNRDFAFDVTSPNLCMRTITGRHINSLYRSSLIQAGITFHGGMTAVAYEWGAPSYKTPNTVSPDNLAQSHIGRGMSDYGGTFPTEIKYPYAPMNDIVYPVNGGMEDWAYASSWGSKVVPGGCTPSTYGGYPRELTVYNDAVLRSVTVLVEASMKKKPNRKDLGGYWDIFNPRSGNNGHVPRNVRLTLMVSDVVEPWVNVESINNVTVVDRDRIPGIGRSSTSCMVRNKVSIPAGLEEVTVKWSVWGSVEVDETNVMVVVRSEGDGLTCGNKFWTTEGGGDGNEVNFKSKNGTRSFKATVTDNQKGEGRWARAEDADFTGTQFQATLDLRGLEGKSFAIIVRAKVDSSWGKEREMTGAVFDGSDKPESHIVNARTNTEWRKENAGKVVEGRTEWFSGVISAEWGAAGTAVQDVGVIGSRVTFDESMISGGGGGGGDDGSGGGKERDDNTPAITDVDASRFDIILMAFGTLALLGILYAVKNRGGNRGKRGASGVEIEGFEMRQADAV
ncbi:hypothetical protein TrCOL_g8821 [Triparma columacea]|uniref:Peptidase M14 domain-containing protein n=1 Tax=Triparma columacea TaxID=722753 RepID=A0A9W7G717_9STRA|nr:hypothetical protein TrCOL_g8821 [Triparma columacea]